MRSPSTADPRQAAPADEAPSLSSVAAGYRPIEDYAFLSDCRSSALVSRDGSIDWLCWPRFDSASIFGAILDRDRGGFFSLRPVGDFEATRRYQEGTHVLETTYWTPSGAVRVHDWLHTGQRQALCRLVKCFEGEVEMEAVCQARPDYGHSDLHFIDHPSGWLVGRRGSDRYVLAGMSSPEERFLLRSGDRRSIGLGFNAPPPSDLIHARLKAIDHWSSWSNGISYFGRYREAIVRSALVLKGLQYAPTGALIAASTTSLPEEIGGERNWDYRFSWLRDSAFTLHALDRIGRLDEAQSWTDWLDRIAFESGDHLGIMYSLDGTTDIPERELDHLAGYRGSRPVRIGNGAVNQVQLDVPGEVLDAIWLLRRRQKSPLTPARRRLVIALAERTYAEWRSPDAGIWEMRGPSRHHVYSKAMCWLALDRAVKLAVKERWPGAPLGRWRAARDEIRRQILGRGVCPRRGCLVQSYGAEGLDAANLLLARIGLLPATDPVFVATVAETERELMRGGLILRYQTEQAGDGISGDEATFTICSLWMVLALLAIGRRADAESLFERILSYGNDLGLFAEEIDPSAPAGENQLGNYPQAFTHVALIVAAQALGRSPA